MLQVQRIRNEKAIIVERLGKRMLPEPEIAKLEEAIRLDDHRKQVQTQLDQLLGQRKQLSDEVGSLFKKGERAAAEKIKAQVAEMKETIQSLERKLKQAQANLEEVLLQIPNVPHESVPKGSSEEDNELFRDWPGDLPHLGDQAKPHWELAETFGIFDLQLGTKITGSGFPVFRGKGARLERALINYFLDEAIKAGYEEVAPPLLVNADTAKATGQLPDKEGQMYYVERDDLYLIPTAEVPLTNIYRNEMIDPKQLPIKITGYTPCFRREAGSYGAHVRGLNRVHQFDKVEIVQIVHPDRSYNVLEEMVDHVGRLLNQLELPYRILRLCGGDLGFTSALTFDFEIYSAAQQRWLEVSSVSNFETFQSNRLNVRFKEDKKSRLPHTLNGSALALARIVAGIIENNQTPEGIVIPKVLQTYTSFDLLQ